MRDKDMKENSSRRKEYLRLGYRSLEVYVSGYFSDIVAGVGESGDLTAYKERMKEMFSEMGADRNVGADVREKIYELVGEMEDREEMREWMVSHGKSYEKDKGKINECLRNYFRKMRLIMRAY